MERLDLERVIAAPPYDVRATGEVRFRPSLIGTPNTVTWEALDEHANVVSGKLVLHAAVAESEVVSWAEVTVDPRS